MDGDGIILCSGELWQCERTRAHSALRQLARNDRIKHAIYRHTRHMIEAITITTATSIDPVYYLSYCFGNIIHELVFGYSYPIGAEEFMRLKRHFDSTLTAVASPSMMLVDRWPWMRAAIPTYHRYCRDGFALQKFLMSEVERHMAEMKARGERDKGDKDGGEGNFVDFYLREHWMGKEMDGEAKERL